MNAHVPVGDLLRAWRQRRHLSQLAVATEAEVSTRHLSFLETGRAQPSREMVLRLAELLEIPLRERNALLLAAGFAPMFPEHALTDPALAAAREAVGLVLKGHEPFPALAIDRHWNMLVANAAVAPMMQDIAPHLLRPPVNVLRLSLHPEGLAPRIVNLGVWRGHLLTRLRRQVEVSADQTLTSLLKELSQYPSPVASEQGGMSHSGVIVPLQLASPAGVLSFISTTTVFGTPVDITLAELALETFFPADAATAAVLRALADARAKAI
jgi:transcriptional regulator with XRE-family HTH domain